MTWFDRLKQARRLEQQRLLRLRRKAQKAQAVEQLEQVCHTHHTWNRRFGQIQSLRASRSMS